MSNLKEKEKELFANIEKIGKLHEQTDNESSEGDSNTPMTYQDLKKISETLQQTLIQTVSLMTEKIQNIQKDLEQMRIKYEKQPIRNTRARKNTHNQKLINSQKKELNCINARIHQHTDQFQNFLELSKIVALSIEKKNQ